MKRRDFLRQTITAGFAFAIGPRVKQPKPADGAAPDVQPGPGASLRERWRLHELVEAWRRAATRGVPLLVIVVPEEDTSRYQVGDAWGEVLNDNYVDGEILGIQQTLFDDALAALTLVELVCASQAEIQQALPNYEIQSPDPLLVRINAHQIPARFRAYTTELVWELSEREAQAQVRAWRKKRPGDNIEAGDVVVLNRIAALKALLLSAIQPDADALARARSQEVALHKLQNTSIPGSRWAHSYGCGVYYDTPDPLEAPSNMMVGYGCGMGHVNIRSARFLDFLMEDPTNPVEDFLKTIE